MKQINPRLRPGISRRTFLRAAGVGGTALALGRWPAMASPAPPNVSAADAYVPQPGATQYALRVASTKLNPDGKQDVLGVTANGTFPGPEIRVRRGEQLRLRVENGLEDDATSIHWHGLLVPAAMDGVPDVSNAPIAARGVYVYEFPIMQTGTYWYHSHWRLQEQIGLAGSSSKMMTRPTTTWP